MRKLLPPALLLVFLNAAYVAALPSPTIFYVANVVLHVALGLITIAAVFWYVRTPFIRTRFRGATILFTLCAIAGLYLFFRGATTPHRSIVWIHVAFAVLAALATLPYLWNRYPKPANAIAAGLAILLVFPVSARLYHRAFPNPRDHVHNPSVVPTSMKQEGAGPQSPFWPSSSNTNTGKIIPSNFFMDSKTCAECHPDIYNEWNSSMHHFASFNNQFYRKSIEYMQAAQGGTQGSKWCAGCHDHAVFFNGRFDKPMKDQIDTPEAQNGLGCMSCHSIVHVRSSMGNADFEMMYPPLHKLAATTNPYLRAVNHFLTYLNPEPHRQTFMRPFMRDAEFCSSCHKVHLDEPVNHYRWVRGFNDYDNWQASGVSGQGARSFYYPPKSLTCADCHMPLVPSHDAAARDGKVHSHRFAAANTAVAYVNGDVDQLRADEAFLKSGFITVDLFAASPVQTDGRELEMKRRATAEGPQANSTFAVGEEAEGGGPVFLRDVGKVLAPLNAPGASFEPGSTVRVDAVVRTRKIGHFFPGGTVDAFDVWLELQARDADGRPFFWSGRVDDNGRGAVEPGAHFYRAFLLDAEGNEINKRNAFQARSTLYVRLIPPGAADVAHYRIGIPKDAKGPITLTAHLNYRKFSRYYTEFSYAGEPKPGQPPSLLGVGFDNRAFSFHPANIPVNVSGAIKGRIPELPVVTVAQAEAVLPLAASTAWQPVVRKSDRERWNDWGIGLLLQGDLKGAEYAFRKVTEAEPGYADGWLNVARALIQEGETDAAKPYLAKAMAINPNLGRVHFFNAMVQKADGDYDGALRSLRQVQSQYPRDRVVLNQIGRILFLQRRYGDAISALKGVLAVDPEDVQAHYNLMLAYRGLGDATSAAREGKLFARFKADESSQNITAKARLSSPEANNERQPIHDHESVSLK